VSIDIKSSLTRVHIRSYRRIYAYVNRHWAEMMPDPQAISHKMENGMSNSELKGFMKAFVFDRTGDPNDVLAVRELPKPKPGPGETLVRVRLSPVHPSDMHIMRGRFGRQPTLPASPRIECVGVVEALGSGVAGPAPGTRVVPLNVCGSWRELIVSPAERVIP